MAKEMQASYIEHVLTLQTRVTEQPRELQKLNARIERLRAKANRARGSKLDQY